MISEHLLSNSFRIAIQDQFFTMNHSSIGLTNSIKNQFVFFLKKQGEISGLQVGPEFICK